MAPRKGKAADAAAPRKPSSARRTSRIGKPASKTQLNARFESESGAFSRQIFRNVLRCRRLSSPLSRSPSSRFSRSLSPPSSEKERQPEHGMQNIVLDNKAAALRLRVKTVAREITARKQIAAARESLAAQKFQLQNLTIDNTRTSASIVSVDPITSSSRTVEIVPELNALAAIFSGVLRCYLNDIFYNRLNIKNIIKFTADLFSVAATNTADSSDARSLLNFICAFDIYIFIALRFVLYLTIR